ncbi:MAG: YybH family protein [Alphaproteobacteria bacterium]
MSTRIARRNPIAAAAGLALLALLPGQALAGSPEAESIKDRLQQYESRFNQGNAEAVARLFSEDVVYYDPTGQVHRGREAVEQYYRGNLAAGFSDMTIEVIEIRVSEHRAWDIARYTITDPKGEPLAGHHLAILEKEDGEWIVRRTLVNAEMPEPPAD